MNHVRIAHQRRSCPPPGARRARGRAPGERGISVIEAAFVTPVFIMMVLGIMEVGLAMNDYLAVSNSVRAGARTASATGNDPYGDWSTLRVVMRESSALKRAKIEYVVVYKATSFGAAPTATCQAGTSVANVCNVYRPADYTKDKTQFACQTTSPDRFWCPSNRKVTMSGAGTEYVGVWMKYNHDWVTKMFGSTKVLADQSVIRLEPRQRG